MPFDEAVIGLDIGTTKVCTVVGQGEADGAISILGVGIVPARGLRKGVVIDVDDTVTAIRESVERAQHMAGISISRAVAGVTGEHIQSANRRGTATVTGSDMVITQEDIDRALQAAAMEVPRDREIIHSLPRGFAVDGNRGVRRPLGMCGQRLEVETHVVTGKTSFLQNVVQCMERAGVEVETLVLEPIATSEAVATEDERELGVVLIDIGGGTSDIAAFHHGSIIYSGVLPVGGSHVTRDISIGLRTPLEVAERLKVEQGIASSCILAHGEALEVVTAGSGEMLRLPRAILGEIIEARMTELLEMARDLIAAGGVEQRLPAGLILTGGGALLPGALELAGQVFDLPVRLGKPLEVLGWSEQVDGPQYATAVGLLRFGLRERAAAGDSLAAGDEKAPVTESEAVTAGGTTAGGTHSGAAPGVPGSVPAAVATGGALAGVAGTRPAAGNSAAEAVESRAAVPATEGGPANSIATGPAPAAQDSEYLPPEDEEDELAEPAWWVKLGTWVRQVLGFDIS